MRIITLAKATNQLNLKKQPIAKFEQFGVALQCPKPNKPVGRKKS
ncbi:hypothetical protein N9V38_00600 [Planktomarina temperata]|nr:hypothetical protein [Planktomarina temperata]